LRGKTEKPELKASDSIWEGSKIEGRNLNEDMTLKDPVLNIYKIRLVESVLQTKTAKRHKRIMPNKEILKDVLV
jgi:hypothetical protein